MGLPINTIEFFQIIIKMIAGKRIRRKPARAAFGSKEPAQGKTGTIY